MRYFVVCLSSGCLAELDVTSVGLFLSHSHFFFCAAKSNLILFGKSQTGEFIKLSLVKA